MAGIARLSSRFLGVDEPIGGDGDWGIAKMLREHVGDISIGIDAVVFDKIASGPMAKHADLNKLTLVIGTVPSRILQQRQRQRTEYVHALRKHRPHDLRVIQHFVKVTPKTILASGLILQSRPLHFLTVEVIPNDALDGGGDDLEVAVATALVSTLLHDGGAGLVQGIF